VVGLEREIFQNYSSQLKWSLKNYKKRRFLIQLKFFYFHYYFQQLSFIYLN